MKKEPRKVTVHIDVMLTGYGTVKEVKEYFKTDRIFHNATSIGDFGAVTLSTKKNKQKIISIKVVTV